jgi:micrococcal nuclease
VVDGDTIEIDYSGKKAKVRMLCINAPESVHPDRSKNTEAGKIASEFTKERLTGRWVLLEFEGKEKEDRYGRLLAYVHVNYNVELIHYGHSEYYTKYGKSARYYKIFQEAAGQ